jgi:CHAD domain-containing protein
MREFARWKASALLAALAAQMKRSAAGADEEAVHDLRVTIRRVSRALRAFAQFFPVKARKRVRRELGELMDAAAEVRDRDIAAQLFVKAGMAKNARVLGALARERAAAGGALETMLGEWRKANRLREWKGALKL